MDKKIYSKEFNELLRHVSDISDKERQYLDRVFSSALQGGLSLNEMREQIRRLSKNQADDIDYMELEKVKRKLLEVLQ